MQRHTMKNLSLSFKHSQDLKTNRSAKITDHLTCTSANVTHCITCTLCKNIYIGETGRRWRTAFTNTYEMKEKKRHMRASKPVGRHFYLPNHSQQNMTICVLSLHQSNMESRSIISNRNSSFNWVHLSSRDQ